jgi:hypothetical protein
MLIWLRRLFDAAYLYAIEPAPTLVWSRGLVAAGVALLAVAGGAVVYGAMLHRKGGSSGWAWLSAACWGAAGASMLARPLLWGVASARVWAFSWAGLGLAVLALGIAPQLADWFGRRPVRCWLALGAIHALGLAGWWLFDGAGLPWAIALVGLLVDAVVRSRRGRKTAGLPVGAPLLLTYASLTMRWALAEGLGVDLGAYHAFGGADLLSLWFGGSTMAWVGAVGAVVLALDRVLGGGTAFRRGVALIAILLGLGIAVAVGVCHMAAGVTASDPYCYLQMAADLVERGTVLHPFPLAAVAREVGVPLWPVVHVGYHVPNAANVAATVWPIGWSLLLAPVYAALGETGALWLAMACLVATAVVTGGLCRRLLAGSPWGGWVAAGVAGFLVATSQEAVLRSLVPMADAAAALFSVAMLACLVRARESGRLGWSLAAGICYAAAYWIRHPLLFLGLGALPIYGVGRRGERVRWRELLAFAAAALLVAAPDLVYHTVVFAAPWITESPEWFLLSPVHVLATAWAMLTEGFLKRTEFGYLWPLTIWGLLATRRERQMERGDGMILAWSLIGAAGFQLCYQALRWRDLISLLPWLAIWTAAGLDDLLQRIPQGRWRHAVIVMALMLLLGRTAWVMALPQQEAVAVFGHVSALQRQAFADLAARLPDDAVVATGLSSGSVERYVGRDTMRPADWTEEEFAAMLSALEEAGREVWLLEDSEEVAALLERIPPGWEPVVEGDYDLPAFGWGAEPTQHNVRLWRLVPGG